MDLEKLAAQILSQLNLDKITYTWKVSDRSWLALGTHFREIEDNAARNTALRSFLRDEWHSSTLSRRLELATWMVRDWGGIKTNKEETIERYVLLAGSADPQVKFYGISSFTKVLTIVDSDRYAIYDARVATSLNALQLITGCHALAFPYPPGRNSEIDQPKTKKGFSDVFTRRELLSRGFSSVRKDDSYRLYLDLLGLIRRASGKTLLEIEMQLFGQAIELSQEVRRQGFFNSSM